MNAIRRGLLPALAIVASLLVVVWIQSARGEEEATPTPEPTIADLAFLAGRWTGRFGDGPCEESWSRPLGNAMVGTFRALKGEATVLYEFLVFEQTEDGIALRMRHFDAELVGWASEAKGPLTYPLVSLKPGEAVFEDPALPFPSRMTYRVLEGSKLDIVIGGTQGGEERTFAFHFKRADDDG